MHLIMMALYAAIAATVLAAIEMKPLDLKARFIQGLKIFGAFLLIGIALSWILYPIPW